MSLSAEGRATQLLWGPQLAEKRTQGACALAHRTLAPGAVGRQERIVENQRRILEGREYVLEDTASDGVTKHALHFE